MRDGGVALQSRPAEEGSKPPRGALAEDRGLERRGKGTTGLCQVWTGKMSDGSGSMGPLSLTCRNPLSWHRNRGCSSAPGLVWEISAYCPGGARHIGSMSPVQALVWNV